MLCVNDQTMLGFSHVKAKHESVVESRARFDFALDKFSEFAVEDLQSSCRQIMHH